MQLQLQLQLQLLVAVDVVPHGPITVDALLKSSNLCSIGDVVSPFYWTWSPYTVEMRCGWVGYDSPRRVQEGNHAKSVHSCTASLAER
jgi:hypothetical protein